MVSQDARFGRLIIWQCGNLSVASEDFRYGRQRHPRKVQRRVTPATATPVEEREVVQ